MTKKISYEEYNKIGEQFNEIIGRITHLEVDVLNSIGKTKARKKANQIVKGKEILKDIRSEIENDVLNMYPNAPLITSFRKYRGQEDYNQAPRMDEETAKWMNGQKT